MFPAEEEYWKMVRGETGRGVGALSKLEDLAKAKTWSRKSRSNWGLRCGRQAGLVQVGVRVERALNALNAEMRSWEFIAGNESW